MKLAETIYYIIPIGLFLDGLKVKCVRHLTSINDITESLYIFIYEIKLNIMSLYSIIHHEFGPTY